MNTKLLTSVGCLLLLAAVIAPSVLGHSERPAALLNDYDPAFYNGNDVSGKYFGAAGPAIAIDAYNQASPNYNVFAAGSMLCDAEVVFDSNAVPLGWANEGTVDGSPTIGLQDSDPITPGKQDTVDDGGQGGACHSTSYDTQIFNTANCYSGNPAFAYSDLGLPVWLGATCDWKTDEGGQSSLTTFQLCVVNAALQDNDPVPCVEQLVTCMTNPACGATGAVQSCGPDHVADAIDFGYGMSPNPAPTPWNPVIFPNNGGIVNGDPAVHDACDDGPAAVFVFDAVATNGGTTVEGEYIPDPTSVQVYPAGNGDIWG